MADDTDIQPPQDTYSGGQPVMSRVDPDGQEYIWDQQSRKMVSIGPVTDPARLAIIRARSTPTYEDANRKAAMAQGAEADRINAQRDTSTPEQRQYKGQKVMDAWLNDAVSAMSPEALASMRPQDVARSPNSVSPIPQVQPAAQVSIQSPPPPQTQQPVVAPHQSSAEELTDRLQLFDKLHGDPVQDRSVTLEYVKRLLGGTSGTETPTESNPEGKAQVSPIEQAAATKTLTDQMRKEEASLMPAPRPQTPAPITPPQTGTQPMPQAPVLPPGGSPIAPPQQQMADPATIARLRAQRPVPGTRTPPSPASIQSYNLQMYQRAVAGGMPQKQAAQIYLGPMLAAQGQAKTHVVGKYLVGADGKVLFSPPDQPDKPKLHFGKNGEVLQMNNDKVDVIRPPDTQTPKASVAVNKRYAALVAEETQANLENNPRKARTVRAERETFEQEHPELGFKPSGTVTAAPQQPAPTPAPKIQPGAVPKVTSKDQFDALPKGAIYIGEDGKRYRKP